MCWRRSLKASLARTLKFRETIRSPEVPHILYHESALCLCDNIWLKDVQTLHVDVHLCSSEAFNVAERVPSRLGARCATGTWRQVWLPWCAVTS